MVLEFLNPIGAAGSGLGSLVSGIGQLFGMGRPSLSAQLDVSKRMAQYEHDLNMQAWREQVAYNDPSRQAERLENAGFSRHNLVGNASIAGNASGVPTTQVDTPDVSKFQRGLNLDGLSTIFGSLLSFENAQAELENKQATNEHIKEQTKLTEQDKLYRQLEQDNMRLNMAYTNLKMYQEGELFKRNLDMQDALIDKTYKEIDRIVADIDETNARISNLNEDTLNKQEQRKQIQAIAEHYNISNKAATYVYNNYTSKGIPLPVDHGPSDSWPSFLQSFFDPTLRHLKSEINSKIIEALEGNKGSRDKYIKHSIDSYIRESIKNSTSYYGYKGIEA